MTNKQTAKDKIEILVTRFKEQYQSYKHSDYNETLTRRDFIDPFFKALGWDIDNESGYAEAYREVIHEDKVKVSGATKAPDYSFRLVGGKRLFFVEAKKPSVSVREDMQPAYQVRRYGWSAKHPISIITDFEEFAIYDCTKKPKPTDKPAVARIKYLTFSDYIIEFDFIWDTFSKEQVLKGSFDKFLLSDTHKKGTATVDKDFLESLDRWRTYLAVNISWNNRTLNEDEINFVVQQTIDRLIFLRIAEDRSVEPYGTLKNAVKQGNLYSNLYDLFRKADEKYNSGLFDFKKDKVSQSVVIENKIIRTIINELYYPECPYEFSVLSVEILGSAYEQFLGKVIRITPAHHAKIEEKPEVRKAGGVYYTPQYIVDYIVKNTVGKLIEGKTPKEISKIKILDPACGSGSFLIGAFQYLLDYHKDFYSENGKPSKGKKDNPLTPDGHLTTAEKKRILLNNIHGVDLDTNAVEVTKLSLLIKCLEGETEASIKQQFTLWNERVLPTLENNIKGGNSLIDTDIYDNQLDFGEERNIRPFNWKKAFPEIFKQEGFDIVIGNPPWGADFPEKTTSYIRGKYLSATEGSFDSYSAFIERGLSILSSNGLLGFITPDTFLRKDDFYLLRKHVFENYSFYEIIETGPVFSQVRDTWCCIFVLANAKPSDNTIINHKKISRYVVSAEERLEYFKNNHWESDTIVSQTVWRNKNKFIVGYRAETEEQKLIEKIEKFPSLGSLDIFRISRGEEGSKFKITENKSGLYRMVIPADIETNYVADGKPIDDSNLTTNKITNIYTHPKIWITRIQKMRWKKRIVSALDTRKNSAGMKTLQAIMVKNDEIDNLYFLQSILSSKLINFYCTNYLSDDMNQLYLSRIPIFFPDNLKDSKLLALKLDLIQITKGLTEYKKDALKFNLQKDISQTETRIDYFENKINNIVYQLYGLNKNEILIIEKS
jgi:type I restriction-modification system DNA methylase subunit